MELQNSRNNSVVWSLGVLAAKSLTRNTEIDLKQKKTSCFLKEEKKITHAN